jgi:hypothetical protein
MLITYVCSSCSIIMLICKIFLKFCWLPNTWSIWISTSAFWSFQSQSSRLSVTSNVKQSKPSARQTESQQITLMQATRTALTNYAKRRARENNTDTDEHSASLTLRFVMRCFISSWASCHFQARALHNVTVWACVLCVHSSIQNDAIAESRTARLQQRTEFLWELFWLDFKLK